MTATHRVVKQKVYHDGTSMVVLKKGSEATVAGPLAARLERAGYIVKLAEKASGQNPAKGGETPSKAGAKPRSAPAKADADAPPAD